MTTKIRDRIRAAVKPFPRKAAYPTGWGGEMTFEQIYDNLVHYASNVMKSKGIHRTNYLPDCLQIGFMSLWKELIEDNQFLADKTRQQAVFFVLARCKISSLRGYDARYDELEEIVSYDWHNTWDEHTITGITSPSSWYKSIERWAPWATELDIRIDVERVMQKLADKYADSFEHLMALYAVTTCVTFKDTAPVVGMHFTTWRRNYLQSMQQEVQYEFAQVFLEKHDYQMPEAYGKPETNPGCFTSPYTKWRDQYESGNTEPAEELLEQYSHTICIIGALKAQIAGKTYKQAALDLGKNPKTFPRYMKRAARMLSAAYA